MIRLVKPNTKQKSIVVINDACERGNKKESIDNLVTANHILCHDAQRWDFFSDWQQLLYHTNTIHTTICLCGSWQEKRELSLLVFVACCLSLTTLVLFLLNRWRTASSSCDTCLGRTRIQFKCISTPSPCGATLCRSRQHYDYTCVCANCARRDIRQYEQGTHNGTWSLVASITTAIHAKLSDRIDDDHHNLYNSCSNSNAASAVIDWTLGSVSRVSSSYSLVGAMVWYNMLTLFSSHFMNLEIHAVSLANFVILNATRGLTIESTPWQSFLWLSSYWCFGHCSGCLSLFLAVKRRNTAVGIAIVWSVGRNRVIRRSIGYSPQLIPNGIMIRFMCFCHLWEWSILVLKFKERFCSFQP